MKKFVFTEAWKIYKIKTRHLIVVSYSDCLKSVWHLAKLLQSKGIKFYTDNN